MTFTKFAISVAAHAAVAAALLATGAHAQPFPHGRCIYNVNIDSYNPNCNVAAQAPVALPVTTLPPSGPSNFQQGLADRTAWENWFNGTTGELHAGAYWWSGQRSLPNPGMCETLGGDATIGCLEAKAKLDQSDYKRHVAPAYRMGWNSYTGTPATVAVTPAQVAPPAAPAPQVNVTVNNVAPQAAAPASAPVDTFPQAPQLRQRNLDDSVNDADRTIDAMCKDLGYNGMVQAGMYNSCVENHRQLVERGAAR